MIRLHRLDGTEMLLNTAWVRRVEKCSAGSAITLSSGEVLEVKNPVIDIMVKTRAGALGQTEENALYEANQAALARGENPLKPPKVRPPRPVVAPVLEPEPEPSPEPPDPSAPYHGDPP